MHLVPLKASCFVFSCKNQSILLFRSGEKLCSAKGRCFFLCGDNRDRSLLSNLLHLELAGSAKSVTLQIKYAIQIPFGYMKSRLLHPGNAAGGGHPEEYFVFSPRNRELCHASLLFQNSALLPVKQKTWQSISSGNGT